MDIETQLFKLYKEYMINNSSYDLKDYIYNDTPQELINFPTILFLENDNSDSNMTVDKVEYVSNLQYKVELYTKNIVVGGNMTPRKIITNELKKITFDFLHKYNLNITSCTKGEYLDFNVDRTIIIAECNVSNWDGKIR